MPLTDLRPIVERLLRRLVLAGVPVVMAAGCGDNRNAIELGGDGGAGGGGSGGGSVVTIGTGGIGDVGDAGGRGSGGGGAGGGPGTGGAATGGNGTGGSAPDGGASSCGPFSFRCGFPSSCGVGGDGGTATLPLSTAMLSFDPADPRWADFYRACAAQSALAGCVPDCSKFFLSVLGATSANMAFFADAQVTCGADGQGILNASYALGVCGRRPRAGAIGDRSGDERGATLGDCLAEAAELEAASVPAFRRLANDLAAHGSPADLVSGARAAIAEEARHWRRTRDLARRRGGRPVRPAIAAAPPATLEELAIDNVIEGCVRETFGAMVAAHQATEARDPEVRDLMAGIAGDELGHAALAWKIDAWAAERLGPGFRARRQQAAAAAVHELLAGAAATADAPFLADAGLPGRADAEALLAGAWSRLWAPALLAAS